jgi:hypothetical protein
MNNDMPKDPTKIEVSRTIGDLPSRVPLNEYLLYIHDLINEYGPEALLDTEWDYDHAMLGIIYLRDETPEEREKRIAKEQRAAERAAMKAMSPEEKKAYKEKLALERQAEKDRQKEEKERKLLAELKAKYE